MTFSTSEGTFVYRHIKKDFFKGYMSIVESNNQSVYVALPEKSLLDLIYLTPGGDRLEYLQELRLQNTEKLNKEKLLELAEESGSQKLMAAAERVVTLLRVKEEMVKL